jgi:hypothetical protein
MNDKDCFRVGRLRDVEGPALLFAALTPVLLCSLVLTASASIAFGADRANALIFPGDDPQELKAIINDVLNGIKKNDSSLKNIWVTGTFLVGEGEGPPPQTIDSRLLKAHKFMWLIRDGKRRYEEDVFQRIGGVEEAFTGYRLMTDKAIFRLTRKQLSVFPLEDWESRWRRQTVNVSDFQVVYDLSRSVPFSQFLASCVARIDDKIENRDPWQKQVSIKCSRTGSAVTVTASPTDKQRPDSSTVRFDVAKNYLPVYMEHVLGKDGGPLYDHVVCRLEYEEIAPTVFYPKRGWRDARFHGIAQGDGWRHKELHVNEIKFGDFDCDPSLFDPDKLPVPNDADILDYR